MKEYTLQEVLLYFSLLYEGDYQKIYQALQRKEIIDDAVYDKKTSTLKCKYTTMISDDYPVLLREIDYPPFVLFYYGNLEYLNNQTIGVIGMRLPSPYGKDATSKFVKELVKNEYTIVSGMALGIDSIAHLATINHFGSTVAVLGSGIDYCYPRRNQHLYDIMKCNHLIISEYPGALVPQKINFPRRNRIIAGLSDKLLVCESREKSGTMITVGFALDQGKNIFCIPSNITGNIGCNVLIQQGAKLVNSISDITDEEFIVDKKRKTTNN